MATWEDVSRLALALPGVEEVGRSWKVRRKGFVWERPLGKADRKALGADAPDGPVLGARVPDEGAKFALIADAPDVYFTIPHFDGYPAVLARLERIEADELEELIVEAWLELAPERVAAEYLREARGELPG